MIQRASVDEMVTAFLNERQATTEEMALVSNALAAYSFIAGKNSYYTNSPKTTPFTKAGQLIEFYFQL